MDEFQGLGDKDSGNNTTQCSFPKVHMAADWNARDMTHKRLCKWGKACTTMLAELTAC